MSSTKILLSLCMVAFVAACSKGGTADEVVYVEEPAITVDEAHTSKYK